MTDVQVTIHKIGLVTCALSGKETDGLVVTMGEYKQTPLSWKSLKQLLGMKFGPPAKPAPAVPVNGPAEAAKK